jgi:hypothetical protein
VGLKFIGLESGENVNPTWIDIWYNRRAKMWVAQLKDENGNQHENSFYGSKIGCEVTEKSWEQEYSIDHTYSLKVRQEHKVKLKNLR